MSELYQWQGFRARFKCGNFSALDHSRNEFRPVQPERDVHCHTWRHILDRKDISKLGELARIAINESDAAEVADRINDVLSLVDQLQAADTQGIEPMSHPLDSVQVLRADDVTETNQRDTFQSLAPAAEKGLYLVPKVIE